MCHVADQLQRAARQPPGNCGRGAGVRLGANPEGRGAAVSATEQPETPHHQPEGDQPQATDVPGTCAVVNYKLTFDSNEEEFCDGEIKLVWRYYTKHAVSHVGSELKFI